MGKALLRYPEKEIKENEENNTTTESLHNNTFNIVTHFLVRSPFPAGRLFFIPLLRPKIIGFSCGRQAQRVVVRVPCPAWAEPRNAQRWQGWSSWSQKEYDADGFFFPTLRIPTWATFPTCSYTLLRLHWFATPSSVQIYCIWCGLQLFETCSFISLLFQIPVLPSSQTALF